MFLHFGLPRTASTTLQHNIFTELEDHVFVCAPYTQEHAAFNKLQYADDILFNQEELAGEVARIEKRCPDKGILISDENFFGAPNANFMNRTRIAERLAAIRPDAELVIFIRDQRSLIRSLYSQFVKSGSYSKAIGRDFISSPGGGLSWQRYTSVPPKWTRELRYIDYQSWMSVEHFFYDEILAFYKALFAQVHVILYEDFSDNPRKVLSRLEGIFGAKFSERAYGSLDHPSKNASLSSRELYATALGNRMRPVFPRALEVVPRKLSEVAAFLRGGDYEQSIDQYLSLLVSDQELTRKNIIANETHALGMERFPEQYFPAM